MELFTGGEKLKLRLKAHQDLYLADNPTCAECGKPSEYAALPPNEKAPWVGFQALCRVHHIQEFEG